MFPRIVDSGRGSSTIGNPRRLRYGQLSDFFSNLLDGKGWFWYEVLSTGDGESPTAANWGVSSCLGCHTSGRDFVLSDYPLR